MNPDTFVTKVQGFHFALNFTFFAYLKGKVQTWLRVLLRGHALNVGGGCHFNNFQPQLKEKIFPAKCNFREE